MKAWEADRLCGSERRTADPTLTTETGVSCIMLLLGFPHSSWFIWSFFGGLLVFISLLQDIFHPKWNFWSTWLLLVAKSWCFVHFFLYFSLVKCWQSGKQFMKQKWIPLCLFSASFQIRTAQTWRQKRGSAVEYAACSFYLVLSDLSLGSSWCRKMICDIYDVWLIMYDIWRQKMDLLWNMQHIPTTWCCRTCP